MLNTGKLIRIIVVFAAVSICFVGVSLADNERLEAELERNRVTVGNPVYLNIVFHGSQNVARPDMPEVDGLRIKYVGPATQVFVNNRQVSQAITHSYLVIPLKDGDFKIGPFFVEYRGETFSAAAVILSVNDGSSVYGIGQAASSGQAPSPVPSGQQSQDVAERKPYSGDKIILVASVPRREVYINEVVKLSVKLYVDNMGLQEIEYPAFPLAGFSADKWGEPEKTQERYMDSSYNVLVFEREIFGIKEGEYVLGPASLGCKAVVPRTTRRRSSMFGRSIFDDDFFSNMFTRNEVYPVELESEVIRIKVLPFPEVGKPSDFQGAVGDYSMETHVDIREVRVGDPITVRTIIMGTGNIDTVTAPEIDSMKDLKTYEPQVTKTGNKKIYEQILIPKSSDVKEIPAVSLSFFNPKTERYKTITSGPVSIKVTEQPESEKSVKVVSMGGKSEMFYPPEKLGRDIIHIKSSIGNLQPKGEGLYSNFLFWAVQIAMFFIFLVFYGVYRRKEKIRTDKRYARFLVAPGKARKGMRKAKTHLDKGNIDKFYDSIFDTFQKYLAGKLGLPIGAVTASGVENKLRSVQFNESIITMVRDIFAGCDMARYASTSVDADTAGAILNKVRRVIDHLEKARL